MKRQLSTLLNLFLLLALSACGTARQSPQPAPGRPAIDLVPACTLDADQRGEPRQDSCDIGAYEAQTP